MAAIGNMLVNITGSIKGLQKALDEATGKIKKSSLSWTDALAIGAGLGVTNLAIEGLGNVAGLAAEGLASAFEAGWEFNNSLEQTTATINAFTKDGAKTAEILAMIQERAAKTPFTFDDMSRAAAALIPSAKQAGTELEGLVEMSEILAASNPAQGLEGAAFALKEAVSGDFTSIIERFNLPRSYINQLKKEGVPALEIVSRAMKELGLDSSLVANLAETAEGRWSTLSDTFTTLAAKVTQPIFTAFSDGLGRVNTLLAENEPMISSVADSIAEIAASNIQMLIDGFVALAPHLPGIADALSPIADSANKLVQSSGDFLKVLTPITEKLGLGGSSSAAWTVGLLALKTALDVVTTPIRTIATAIDAATWAVKQVIAQFQRWYNTIMTIKNGLGSLDDALPEWLRPSSPPPLYFALRDITGAMQDVAGFGDNLGLSPTAAAVGGGGQSLTTINIDGITVASGSGSDVEQALALAFEQIRQRIRSK